MQIHYIDAQSNQSSPVEFVQNQSQYSFTSKIIHLLTFYLQKKKKTKKKGIKLYSAAGVDSTSKLTGYIKLLQF